MTLQQLRYAIEIEKSGSLSKAAKKLFVSQPNLSNAIKSLEDELNITIFKRNNRGIQTTNDGITFLIYARSVLNQCEDIKKISQNSSSSLKIITHNYTPVMEAFVKFVGLKNDNDKIKYEIINAQSFQIIDKVYKQEADSGVFLIDKDNLGKVLEHLKDRNLNYVSIGTLPFYLKFRKNHPILKDRNIIFKELHKYPFVQFRDDSSEQLHTLLNSISYNPINSNKIISVSDRDVKFRIINETDAFGVGTKLHPTFSNIYDWVRIPIPEVYAQVGYIHSINRNMSIEAQNFIEILKKELNGLVI